MLIQFQYLLMSGRLKRWTSKNAAASVVLFLSFLMVPPQASAADYVVTWSIPSGRLEINRMHSWILHIEDENGNAIEAAIVDVEGGMPEHNHGLPTKPRVTTELGGGDYKLEGMRFHMSGYWEIIVSITTDAGTSKVMLPLQL